MATPLSHILLKRPGRGGGDLLRLPLRCLLRKRVLDILETWAGQWYVLWKAHQSGSFSPEAAAPTRLIQAW